MCSIGGQGILLDYGGLYIVCYCIFYLQLSDPVYSSLFELYRQRGKAGQLFVLQFVPVLIWTYLSAITRRDEQVSLPF